MNREPAYTFDRFIHETFEQFRWSNKGELTYVAMLERVREAYPNKKFTRADFLQHKHRYEKGGL